MLLDAHFKPAGQRIRFRQLAQAVLGDDFHRRGRADEGPGTRRLDLETRPSGKPQISRQEPDEGVGVEEKPQSPSPFQSASSSSGRGSKKASVSAIWPFIEPNT